MTVYSFAHFQFDPQNGRLTQQEQVLTLRPKTAQLLTFFIQHRDRILSKPEILEQVWEGAAVHDQVIFQSVNEIRKILGEGTFIRTFPKKGYQWVCPTEEVASFNIVEEQSMVVVEDPVVHKRSYSNYLFVAGIFFLTFVGIYQMKETKQETPVQKQVAKVTEAAKRRLAVLPFENGTKDPEMAWITMGLMDMVAQNLASQSELELSVTEEILAAINHLNSGLGEEQRLLELHRALDVRYLVAAKVRLAGTAFLVDYVLSDQLGKGERGTFEIEKISQLANRLTEMTVKVTSPQQNEVDCRFSEDEISDEDYAQGLQQFYSGNFSKAIVYLEVALAKNPQFYMARIMLMKTFLAMGAWEKAAPHADDALKDSANDIQGQLEARLLRAEIALSKAKSAHALEEAKLALALSEKLDNTRAIGSTLEIMARAHQGLGDLAQAERCYRSALGSFEDVQCQYSQIAVLLGLANLLRDKGDLESAESFYKRAALYVNRSDARFEGALVEMEYGQLLKKAGRFKEAHQRYEKAMGTYTIFREMGEIMKVKRELALLWVAQGEIEKAHEVFREDVASQEAYALREYGLLLLELGSTKEGQELLSKAVNLFHARDLGKEAVMASFVVAKSYVESGDHKEAEQWLLLPQQWFEHHQHALVKDTLVLAQKINMAH